MTQGIKIIRGFRRFLLPAGLGSLFSYAWHLSFVVGATFWLPFGLLVIATLLNIIDDVMSAD